MNFLMSYKISNVLKNIFLFKKMKFFSLKELFLKRMILKEQQSFMLKNKLYRKCI